MLNNLGGLAYWRGRWQEAIELYRQAGTCSERAGHAADVAFTDGNIGEILADQGRLDEAAHAPAARASRLERRPATARARRSRTCCSVALAVRAGPADEGLELLHAAVGGHGALPRRLLRRPRAVR